MASGVFKRLMKRVSGAAADRLAAADHSTVPDEVMAAIKAASIVVRHGGDGPNDRIMVKLGAGGAAFWHDPATNTGRLRESFGLSEALAERAARYLANRVTGHLREQAAAVQPAGSAWKAWRPLAMSESERQS
ncbi:MAG TPA: hypothetical protein VGN52_01040 [Burkholderiales bacterium]|jgi:hypothetical protein